MILGTFLLAFAVLFFEVFSTIIMSFVLGSGYIYFVIGIAMLGLSAAASMMSMLDRHFNPRQLGFLLFWSCIALAVLIIVNLVLFSTFKQQINEGVAIAAQAGGMRSIVARMLSNQLWIALWIGALMSIPYFLFGLVITLIFRVSSAAEFHKIYFADLLGAGLGCVAAVVSLEFGGFGVTAMIPSFLALLAAAAYVWRHVSSNAFRVLGIGAMAATMLSMLSLTSIVEPKPQLNTLARDYDMALDVTELWRGWNSFSRVGALRSTDRQGNSEHVMALGNGEGHAHLQPYRPEGYGAWKHRAAMLGTALGTPASALVIFAGTGSDMLALDYYTKGDTRITGVELNHTMIEGARKLTEFRLNEFYSRENVRMVVAEAREFLERDKEKYDVIIVSWSGATIAYHSGAIGHTTQFVYTEEAFEAMLERLTPSGYLVLWNTNKVNSLAAFRRLTAKRSDQDVSASAIVLFEPGTETSNWTRYWDANPLLFKPSGFTEADVRQVKKMAGSLGLSVAYAPGMGAHPDFSPYQRVLSSRDLSGVLNELSQETGLRFSVITDDRPFSLDLFSNKRYLSAEFWSQLWKPVTAAPSEKYRVQQAAFVLAILFGALVLVIGPLLVRGGPPRRRATIDHLTYFLALGSGFMLVEIGLIHKMGLLLGNPGLAIAVVLAGLICFTGVGSLLSRWTFDRGVGFRACVIFIAVYVTAFAFCADYIVQAALKWAIIWKGCLALVILGPLGIVMGHLFPQGLAQASRDAKSFVPWAWAVNGATGTIAAGFAPLFAQAFGFKAVLMSGVAIYLLILFLPAYRARSSEAIEPKSSDEFEVSPQGIG